MHQLIIIVGAMLCFVSVVRAQSLTGVVLDPQGGGVPDAQVKLYMRENGAQLNTTSDPQGKYRFQRLTPGEYVVEADAEGFARTAAQSRRSRPPRRPATPARHLRATGFYFLTPPRLRT